MEKIFSKFEQTIQKLYLINILISQCYDKIDAVFYIILFCFRQINNYNFHCYLIRLQKFFKLVNENDNIFSE